LVDEERAGESILLRRATGTFPPRRAPRAELLLGDGGLAELGHGARDDRTSTEAASWHLQDDRLTVKGSGPVAGTFRVIEVGDQEVVLRRIL
jgi:hypothetical protein